MRPHPGHILFTVGSVHHQHIALFIQAVNDEVIHKAAIFIAQRAVANLADTQIAHIIGDQVLNIHQGIRTGEHNFPHVGYVKESAGGAHRHMLGDDP